MSERGAYCRKCGYCLRGVEAERCPECGRSFMPSDPTTYAQRRPRSRRRRRVIAWFAATVVMTAVGFGAWNAYRQRTYLLVTERCAYCGATHSYRVLELHGTMLPFFTDEVAIYESELTKFLERDITTCAHSWRPRYTWRVDRLRVRIGGALGGAWAMLGVAEEELAAEPLLALKRHLPDLPTMIERDVLQCDEPIFAAYRLVGLGTYFQAQRFHDSQLSDLSIRYHARNISSSWELIAQVEGEWLGSGDPPPSIWDVAHLVQRERARRLRAGQGQSRIDVGNQRLLEMPNDESED